MDFKKLGSMIVSAVMTVTALTTSAFTGSAAAEELMNDTFESGYGAWKGVGATCSITTDYAHSGTSSLYVYDRTNTWGAPRCSMSGIAYAGNSYTFDAWAMYAEGNNSSEQMALKIIYTDSSGQDHYQQITGTNANKGEWVHLSGTYNIPSDVTGIILYMEMPSASTDTCYYIDDITVNGEKLEVEKDTSYLNDFDDGKSQGWNARGSATATVTKDYSHSGDYSVYVSGRTQLWNGLTSSKDDVLTAGKYYSLGCYVMYNDEKWSDTQKFSINLQYDMDGKENYYTIATETANKGEWTYVGSELTIPEGATNCYVYVQTGYVPTAAEQDLMDFYVDTCSGQLLPDPAIEEDIKALKDAYADYFKLGCACADSEFKQGATKDLILKHYNSLTLGNELKPDSVLDLNKTLAYAQETGDYTSPQISLNEADGMLKFAAENKIPVRGHVLVWHSQTPDWFFKENYDANADWVSVDVMNQRLENYIKLVMETLEKDYPDVEFYAWDVVNEAASDSGTIRPAGSNNSVNGQSAWVSVYGDQSYIVNAFTYAKKYAPAGCKLFYNDYNEYSPNKQAYIISDILTPLIEKDLIDGMGMQSHIGMSSPSIELYKQSLLSYADLGLEVQVTELDVSQKSNAVADQLELAQRYQDCFKMFKEVKDSGVNLSAVVIWGITDSTSWIGGYPLLFDKNYAAKPAYYAVIDTDSEVDKIQTMSAYYYDGTDEDMERAFEIQNAQKLTNVTNNTAFELSFKAVWNEDGMIVRLYNPSEYLIYQIFGSTDIQVGESLVSDSSSDEIIDVAVPLTGKAGSTVYLDVMAQIDMEVLTTDGEFVGVYDELVWNDKSWSPTSDTLPTCGIVTLKNQPKMAEAAKGTPEIDGTIDSVWDNATAISLDTYTMGSGATGTAKMLWDENYIYVLAEVKDAVLSNASANAYEQDTFEVFFDENNHKTASYESDDIQARVSYTGEKTVTDGLSTDAFISAAATTSDGYLVEYALPFTIAPFTAGQVVGFDVQINDDGDGAGKRTSIANWNDLTGMGYTDPSGFGVMKLIGDGSEQTGTTTTVTTGGSTTTTTTTTTTTKTTASGEEPADVFYGDVNLDGTVSLIDVVYLSKHLAGSLSFNEQQTANADCCNDSQINSADATALLKYTVESIKALPVTP